MAKYERDGHAARIAEAHRVLEKMQKQLAQMTAAHVAAEEHLPKLTVDEASVEKVVRDTHRCSLDFAPLNARGTDTRRGGRWYASSVKNVLKRS
jgi:hypothetical protein